MPQFLHTILTKLETNSQGSAGGSVAVGNSKICASCGGEDEEGTAVRMARRTYHLAAGMDSSVSLHTCNP